MPYAITLVLDQASAPRVAELWRLLARRGISDEAIRLGYNPHLTLAVLADNAEPPALLEAAKAASQAASRPIALVSLGLFPGPPAALFLSPAVTPELLSMHEALLTTLADQPIMPHYRIGHWVPHVTLAADLTNPAKAVTALGALRLPIDAVLDRVEVVRFRPVEILASHPLDTSIAVEALPGAVV